MATETAKLLQSRQMELGPFDDHGIGEEEFRGSCFRLRRDSEKVAWLLFDRRDASANVLTEPALKELDLILERLELDPPRALVLRSAKASGFCFGADIEAFRCMEDEEAAVKKLEEAHAVATRLAKLPFPTLAFIHGQCLGGGLELALCCKYRLAASGARLGLPEILLGLHPGLGGTARLTHLIDPIEAMSLMLTGKSLRAKKAAKLGLVDKVIEERHLREAVRGVLAGDIERHESGLKDKLLTTRWARQLEAKQMRAKAARKANPRHYPAPGALIDLWEEQGGDFKSMLRAEIRSFARLLQTPTARSLIRIFFLREAMKKRCGAPCGIARVHVVGAGTMGADIAAWCAFSGLRVSLYDRSAEAVAAAVAKAAELCGKKRLSEAQTREVLDRLIPDLKGAGVSKADLVIEAVPEDAALKRRIYRELEPRMKEGALLATNTSCIPLEELARELDRPGRLVGLHFFNPVALMQLVEVVTHDRMDERTKELALAFVGSIDKLPAPVKSAPGFLVNRALTPYLLEAMRLLDEGLRPETVDQAALDFGMPVGPVELADRVGLDICLEVAALLGRELDSPQAAVPGWLREKVAQGELGRKSGRGLYRWKEGEVQKKSDAPEPEGDLADRLILPMINACMACLREGVIEDEALLDGAMIFGTGFAPHRGGPMHYARSRGFGEIRSSLEELAQRHGERFTPDAGWSEEQ